MKDEYEAPDTEIESETKEETRINPDRIFTPVADRVEMIEEGKWVYRFEDALYNDVIRAGYLEGFLITRIEDKNGQIEIEVTELE